VRRCRCYDTTCSKGGKAINLFVRDMPRLSVDLDLVFPDHTPPRDAALARINEALRQAAPRLKKRGFQTHAPLAEAGETKSLVRRASLAPTARDVLMADPAREDFVALARF
jgi:hypothetical protein